MTGESWDLTARATHALLERTNPIAPPSCPPAAGRSRGNSRPERSAESHGTVGMWQFWQQFWQLESPHEIFKVCLLWEHKVNNKAKTWQGETNRAEVHQPLQIFPAAPARLLGLSFGIAKRIGTGVPANLTVRRQERERERKKKKRSSSSDPPRCQPVFGPPQHLLMWRWVTVWCLCDVDWLDSELRWWMLKDSQVRPRG